MTKRATAANSANLPSVDALLKSDQLSELIELWGRSSVHSAINAIQADLRHSEDEIEIDDVSVYYKQAIAKWLGENRTAGYVRVFNVTGTLLHSNLGRAQISEEIYDKVRDLLTRPATVEFDLATGRRGQREQVVCERLCRLIGCEAATVVNNNAAAVLIVLNTLALGAKVVVSRGELIEIGGSFRLPDVMTSAGCELLEVGTTNRTHVRDYQKALEQNPALLLKVHPSNYRIEGFTNNVDESELTSLSKETDIPFVVDLGSGALVNTTSFGLPKEPMPQDALDHGADLVTFSGDKLLGGPQAGLIVGSKTLIDRINANPMKRALRTSKTTLAMLDETLKEYEDPQSAHMRLHALSLLATPMKTLQRRAIRVQGKLAELLSEELTISVQEAQAEVGSGTMPGTNLPSAVVTITADSQQTIEALNLRFRRLPIPVVGRLFKGALELNMHGAEPIEEFTKNLEALA